MDTIDKWFTILLLLCVSTIGYSIIGTSGNVQEIRERASHTMQSRNWEVLRYEGYRYGSWGHHGGTVYYHVVDITNNNIQYRVGISLWDNELQYYYDEPEQLQRIDIEVTK